MPRNWIFSRSSRFTAGRRAMLETVIRCSRHRWTLLKLPPRRIERRLTAAANWFAEQLTRHWAGRVDLLFTSEAMNLANLYRMMPRWPASRRSSISTKIRFPAPIMFRPPGRRNSMLRRRPTWQPPGRAFRTWLLLRPREIVTTIWNW